MQKLCVLVLLLGVMLGSPCLTWAQTAGAPGSAGASLDQPRLVVQLGHSEAVIALAVSPDGRLMLTGSMDHSAILWDTATRRELHRFNHTGAVRAVAFSPDGHFVLLGNVLREVATGNERGRFRKDAPGASSVAFSPNGRFLVTSSKDGSIRLWDIVSGQELCRLISFTDGTWVVVDAEGRFDTNNLDNNSGLHWLMSDDPFTPLPLEIFMRDYYESRLLLRILAGEKFRPVRSLAELNRVQPAVKIVTIEPQA